MNAYIYYLNGYMFISRALLNISLFCRVSDFKKYLKYYSTVNYKMKREMSEFSLHSKVTCFRVNPIPIKKRRAFKRNV